MFVIAIFLNQVEREQRNKKRTQTALAYMYLGKGQLLYVMNLNLFLLDFYLMPMPKLYGQCRMYDRL